MQTNEYANPDLYHEDVDEIDETSLWAPHFATGTAHYSYVLIGDQNAGKSTFLHALTNHESRNFMHLCNYFPMLYSKFINSRLINPHRKPIDEYPFLDTDLARASVLLSIDAFRFFCKEQGLPWALDNWSLAEDIRYVGLTFVEVGGDHLDRMMLFQAMQLAKRLDHEQRGASASIPASSSLVTAAWMSKLACMDVSVGDDETKRSSGFTEQKLPLTESEVERILYLDAPPSLPRRIFHAVLRRSIGLIRASPHSAYFVKLESLLEWDEAFLVEWLWARRTQLNAKLAAQPGSPQKIVKLGDEDSATVMPKRKERAPRHRQVATTEQTASDCGAQPDMPAVPACKLNQKALHTLLTRLCFVADVARDFGEPSDTELTKSTRYVTLLLTRAPLFCYPDQTDGVTMSSVSDIISSLWERILPTERSWNIGAPDSDVPKPPSRPRVYVDVSDLLTKTQRILASLDCTQLHNSCVDRFSRFRETVLNPSEDILSENVPHQDMQGDKGADSSSSVANTFCSQVSHLIRTHGAESKDGIVAPLDLCLPFVLQVALLCLGAESLRIADAHYADHVVVPFSYLSTATFDGTPSTAHDILHALQLRRAEERGPQTHAVGTALDPLPSAVIDTLRSLLIMQLKLINDTQVAGSIPLDKVATAILQCFLQTSERFQEDGSWQPYLQAEHFCRFLVSGHDGHSHGGSSTHDDSSHEHGPHEEPWCDKDHDSGTVDAESEDVDDEHDPWNQAANENELIEADMSTVTELVMLRMFPTVAAALVRGYAALLHCHANFSNLRIAFVSRRTREAYAWQPFLFDRKPRQVACDFGSAFAESHAHESSLARVFESTDGKSEVEAPPIAIRFPFLPQALSERYALADTSLNTDSWIVLEDQIEGKHVVTIPVDEELPSPSPAERLLQGRIQSKWDQLCEKSASTRQAMLFIWACEELYLLQRQQNLPDAGNVHDWTVGTSELKPVVLELESKEGSQYALQRLNAQRVSLPNEAELSLDGLLHRIQEAGVHMTIFYECGDITHVE